MRKLLGPQHCLAGLALDAGQLLFGQAHGALALRQQLQFARGMPGVRSLQLRRTRCASGSRRPPADRIGLAEHLHASAPRLRQRLPARLLLLLACGDPLLQPFEPLRLCVRSCLERLQRLGVVSIRT